MKMKKIKTAEEIFNTIDGLLEEGYQSEFYPEYKRKAINTIKQAQLDMLEYAVNKCLSNVGLKEYEVTPQDVDSISNYMGDVWGIDKQSILKTIDEIKEELK